MAPPRDLDRLAAVVKARRLELGLARNKTAQAIGISKDTWQRVEDGKPVREMNYAKIDPALGWAVGSCTAILDGGEPVVAEESKEKPGAILARAPKRDLDEATLVQAVQSASIAVTDMTAAEIRKLSARIVKDLKESGRI